MLQMQGVAEGALPLRRGRREVGLLFVCLLLLGAGMPAIAQTDSTRAPGRVVRPATLRVSIAGTTNTQAVITYAAPDGGPCTVKVSQQASLTPLVRDVDPILFPGSDQDTRPETVTAQNGRIFVVGKRLTQRASDGKNYSRALETYATHYYQVTCGSAVATGSFTTSNIPLGMTYNDVPQVDENNAGQWMIPTQAQDRTQTIVDPQTGALLKRVSLVADKVSSSNGLFIGYGGFTRPCDTKLQTAPDGTKGYMCIFWQLDQGYGTLYYIVPATGEVRDLGGVYFPYPTIDDDLNVFNASDDKTFRSAYTGNFEPRKDAPMSRSRAVQRGFYSSPDEGIRSLV